MDASLFLSFFQTWVISLSIHGREERKRRGRGGILLYFQGKINAKKLYPKMFQYISMTVSFREIIFFGSGVRTK